MDSNHITISQTSPKNILQLELERSASTSQTVELLSKRKSIFVICWGQLYLTTGARTTLSELLLEQLSKASKGRAMFQSRGVTRYVKIQPVLPAKGRVGVLKTNAKKPS